MGFCAEKSGLQRLGRSIIAVYLYRDKAASHQTQPLAVFVCADLTALHQAPFSALIQLKTVLRFCCNYIILSPYPLILLHQLPWVCLWVSQGFKFFIPFTEVEQMLSLNSSQASKMCTTSYVSHTCKLLAAIERHWLSNHSN